MFLLTNYVNDVNQNDLPIKICFAILHTQKAFKISKLKPYPSFSNKKQEKELVLKNCYKGTIAHTFL